MLTKRQEEIVEVAMEIIDEKGIQNLTIKNISKKIGFSEAAIYRHFKGKVEILLTILSNFEAQINGFIKSIEVEKLSALDTLHFKWEKHFENFAKKPVIAAVIFSEEIFQDENSLSEKIYSIMGINFTLIKNLILKGQKEKIIKNDIGADQLVIIITGALRLIVKKWRMSKYSFDIVKEGEILFRSLIKIISNTKEKEE